MGALTGKQLLTYNNDMAKTTQTAAADVFTAIAHPVRRQLLDLLLTEEQSVNHLAASFEMTRPAISQHLRVLLEVHLVTERRLGRERIYTIRPEELQQVQHWLEKYDIFWQGRLNTLGQYLKKSKGPNQ